MTACCFLLGFCLPKCKSQSSKGYGLDLQSLLLALCSELQQLLNLSDD